MRRTLSLVLLALVAGTALAGQPLERFRGATRLTFSFGDNAPRYGNTDANVRIEVNAFLLGNQVIEETGGADEFEATKTSGSLNMVLDLSKINPLFPPEFVTLTGSDLGSERVRHTLDTILPGPYHIEGTFGGIEVNMDLFDVRVTVGMNSQLSNNVTPPSLNPVLNAECDVQFDDYNGGAGNVISAVPGRVRGWIVAPIFTVNSVRVDVTNIQQAGQVPANIVAPTSFVTRLGRVDAGNAASLAAVDGNVLRVCKFIVPNQIVPPVNVEVSGNNANSTAAFLKLVATDRMATTGAFRRKLELFNFQTNTWDATDFREDVVNTTFSSRELPASGALSRYLGAGNEMRARYTVRQTGPAGSSQWCHEMDELRWVATP